MNDWQLSNKEIISKRKEKYLNLNDTYYILMRVKNEPTLIGKELTMCE